MTSEKVIRTALLVCLLLSLFTYHIINAVIEPTLTRGFYDAFKIAQIIATGVVFFLLVYSKLATRIFLRDRFISGVYKGESVHYRDTVSPQQPHVEVFTVKQNLFDAHVSGKSFTGGSGALIALWTAKLFRVEGNTFYFAMEVSTDKSEFGVLQAIYENGTVHGFYYSGEPETQYASSFWAKRVDDKREQKQLSEIGGSSQSSTKSA